MRDWGRDAGRVDDANDGNIIKSEKSLERRNGREEATTGSATRPGIMAVIWWSIQRSGVTTDLTRH